MERKIENYTLLTFDLRGAEEEYYLELEELFEEEFNGEKLASTTWIFEGLIKSELEEIFDSIEMLVKRYAIIEVINGTIKKFDYIIEKLKRS